MEGGRRTRTATNLDHRNRCLHAAPATATRRVARLDKGELIQRYRVAYADGKRLVAYVMAGELIERRIPPCFWYEVMAPDEATLAQREMLTLFDLTWLRHWHPDHASAVRYQRGKALLIGNEIVFHREAAFLCDQGQRPTWKIVGTLSMTERQQWEWAYLRLSPIKRTVEVTSILSKGVHQAWVHQALLDELGPTRRAVTFGEVEAAAALARRRALWRCSRMAKGGSPSEIAVRYLQLTGTQITSQTAAKPREKVEALLRTKGRDLMG